jgi:hypothetical protein
MSLTATDKGGDFELTPEGTYTARCYRIIDLGTQKGSEMYGGKEQHKVMISWELLNEPFMQDGRPFSVHQRYTVSLSEKAKLRQDLEAWRGKKFTNDELKGFDLSKVMGQYCMVQIVHDETGKYANINSIMAFRGEKPAPINENMTFDIDNPDMAVFDKLSDGIKETIQKAPEWNKNKQAPQPSAEVSEKDVVIEDIDTEEPINLDDIPF